MSGRNSTPLLAESALATEGRELPAKGWQAHSDVLRWRLPV